MPRHARHVSETCGPAARTHTHEALFRAALQTNVARLAFRVVRAFRDALCSNPEATQSDTQLAIETLEGCVRMSRRVMGKTHPRTLEAERLLGRAREQLAAYGD